MVSVTVLAFAEKMVDGSPVPLYQLLGNLGTKLLRIRSDRL